MRIFTFFSKHCRLLLVLLLPQGVMTARPAQSGIHIDAVVPNSASTTPAAGNITIRGSGFSPDTTVYIGGLQVRETKFVSAFTLEAQPPYLRPGSYKIQLKNEKEVLHSNVGFTVIPALVDPEIDRALALADHGKRDAAMTILLEIAKSNSDYQVRAFAHYQAAQIYFSQGDWWRWGAEAMSIFDDSGKSGPAVQTCWRYRLALDQAEYFLPIDDEPDHDQKSANWTVEKDVTENPEPRFFRALVNARYGKLQAAKADSDFILAQEPTNPSYRALAAYIEVLVGDKTAIAPFSKEALTDARALSLLGEAAYLNGDSVSAQVWWDRAGKTYPLGASLAFLAGKKHLARGQQRIAESLLTECIVMSPDTSEAAEARELMAKK